MHFIGAICKPQRPRPGPRAGKAKIIADAGAAMNLHSTVYDPQCHRRGNHFDHRDFCAGSLVADLVHHVRRFQCQETCLVDFNPRIRDRFPDDALRRLTGAHLGSKPGAWRKWLDGKGSMPNK